MSNKEATGLGCLNEIFKLDEKVSLAIVRTIISCGVDGGCEWALAPEQRQSAVVLPAGSRRVVRLPFMPAAYEKQQTRRSI